MFQDRPIDGHIRFSLCGFTDTRAGPDDDGVALARLCDEARMARRFFRFGSLTLPSLIHQTDRAFKTVLMSADVMPDWFRNRPFQAGVFPIPARPDAPEGVSMVRQHLLGAQSGRVPLDRPRDAGRPARPLRRGEKPGRPAAGRLIAARVGA